MFVTLQSFYKENGLWKLYPRNEGRGNKTSHSIACGLPAEYYFQIITCHSLFCTCVEALILVKVGPCFFIMEPPTKKNSEWHSIDITKFHAKLLRPVAKCSSSLDLSLHIYKHNKRVPSHIHIPESVLLFRRNG